MPYEGYFVPLTRANVHLLANKRALYSVGEGIVNLSLHPEGDKDRVLDFGLVTGGSEQVLSAMPAVARGLGYDGLVSFLPHEAAILKSAEEAGFRKGSWGQEAVLFERRIDLGPASYRRRATYAEIAAGKRGATSTGHPGDHAGHSPSGVHEDRWNV